MADFKTQAKQLKNESENLGKEASKVGKYVGEIDRIAAEISLGDSTESIKKTLTDVSEDVNDESKKLKLMSTTLDEVSVQYETTEKRIVGSDKGTAKVGDPADAQGGGDYTEAEKLVKLAEIKAAKTLLELFKLYMHCKLENVPISQLLSTLYPGGIGGINPAAVLNFMNLFGGGVMTVGIGGALGAEAQVNGSGQIAFDQDGNFNVTGTGGFALSPGGEAGGSVVIGFYPGMDSVDDVKGYGVNIGGSFGEGVVGGIDVVFAGEGNDVHPVGFTVSIGAGVALEGHVGMGYTAGTDSYNIYDVVDNMIGYLDEKEEQYR